MERHAQWANLYSEVVEAGRDRTNSGAYTAESYAIFPRYNVLQAVLDSIEALDPAGLPEVEELRSLLIRAAVSASSDFTRSSGNPIEERAMAHEREALAQIFRDVSMAELAEIEPLVYRRVLSADELRFWRKEIENAWGAPDGYWYPLGPKTHPSLVALEVAGIEDSLPQRLRRFFTENAIARLVELRELDASYEIEASAACVAYTSGEGFWTSPGQQWVVYCSHEGTITLGGSVAAELGPEYPASHCDPSARPWAVVRH
jgi:hypothetical protein